jgi:hypothetical protein
MHKLSFFPLGNADCCRIDLENGKKVLFDYAHLRVSEDAEDKRIDLAQALRDDLEQSTRDGYDVVAFTHLDDDHVHGASEFFWFEHATKYQGEGRARIETLWVPAAVLVEEGLTDDARVIRAEARFRLKQKKGIRVFSRPDRLKEWLEKESISINDVRHLITDAGQLAPEFSRSTDGVEFFVHSPFAERVDESTVVDRNDCSLVMQATFEVLGRETRLILSADTTHENWDAIVRITKYHNNESRLAWDVFKLPHHCSYLSLGPEKGDDETEPVPEVKWMFEEQGQMSCVVVSTSKPIPDDDDDDQPPHRQAANYHKNKAVKPKVGEFKVTMEHPDRNRPDTLVITIDGFGATIKKKAIAGAAAVASRPAPRAGHNG